MKEHTVMQKNNVSVIKLDDMPRYDVVFQDVSFTKSTRSKFRTARKKILHNVSGVFKSGQMTAIMGPSGAGKSTLLNLLTGYQTTGMSGRVRRIAVDGNRIVTDKLKKDSCYIMQDDQLNPLFTVWEIMSIAADLKRGQSLSRTQKNELIYEILSSLALLPAKDTRCQMLSGGQKKRLSIALELIDNPPIMFLDEPTTGLDSLSTYQCVTMLSSLAKAGRTIVCTIHQPSATIFEMFDHIYVLTNGQCIYSGLPAHTVQYLSTIELYCPQYHNPADYLMEIANGEYGDLTDQLVSLYTKMRSEKQLVHRQHSNNNTDTRIVDCGQENSMTFSTPSEMYRFRILLYRTGLQLYRDWTVTHLKLALHTLIGVLLGFLYFNYGSDGSKTVSNAGFMIVTAVYLTYTAMMPAVLKFPLELPVLKKERFNNWYKLKTYYAAFLVSHIPIQIIYCFAYASVAYFLSAQPSEASRFFMFVLVCCLVSISAEGMGTVLGTVVNPVNGTFFGAISCAVMLVVAGFLCFYPHMPKPLYMMSYLSYVAYGVEALIQTLYGFDRGPLPCPSEEIYCHYRVPQSILKELGMDRPSYWTNVMSLCGFVIFFRVVAYFTLKRKLA